MFRNTNKFNQEFSIMSGLIKIIFAIALIGTLTVFGYRFFRMSKGNPQFEITVPSYGGTMPDVYFTEHYLEREGCILFKDEFGFDHKVCGAYQVRKW